jgi:CBS domain-containing protein
MEERGKRMRPVRELMSAGVLSVTPSLPLRDALELFAARHIGGAPVVEGGKVIGVLSMSDILSFQASTPVVPSLEPVRAIWEEEPPEEPQEGDEAAAA